MSHGTYRKKRKIPGFILIGLMSSNTYVLAQIPDPDYQFSGWTGYTIGAMMNCSFEIDLSYFVRGLYLIKIRAKQGVELNKLILK